MTVQPKFRLDSGVRTGASAAASLASTLLFATKCRTWELMSNPPEDRKVAVAKALQEIAFTDDQVALLDEWATNGALSFLVCETKNNVTLASCGECGRWSVLAEAMPPAKCNLTHGCEGRMFKGSRAKKIDLAKEAAKETADDDADGSDDGTVEPIETSDEPTETGWSADMDEDLEF